MKRSKCLLTLISEAKVLNIGTCLEMTISTVGIFREPKTTFASGSKMVKWQQKSFCHGHTSPLTYTHGKSGISWRGESIIWNLERFWNDLIKHYRRTLSAVMLAWSTTSLPQRHFSTFFLPFLINAANNLGGDSSTSVVNNKSVLENSTYLRSLSYSVCKYFCDILKACFDQHKPAR